MLALHSRVACGAWLGTPWVVTVSALRVHVAPAGNVPRPGVVVAALNWTCVGASFKATDLSFSEVLQEYSKKISININFIYY